MAQLVASISGVGLGGVVEVVGSNLARGKIFTASIASVNSLYIHPLSIADCDKIEFKNKADKANIF